MASDGQVVRRGLDVQEPQGLIRQGPPGGLLQPLGGGIDGGQPRLGLLVRRGRIPHPVLRVNHLQAVGALAYLPVAAQPHPGTQDGQLLGGEVEEAQQKSPAQSGSGLLHEPDLEGTASPVADLGVCHLPLHQGLGARAQLRQGDQPGAVLVAHREVEQQVLDAVDTQPVESVPHPRTHPRQPLHRHAFQGLRAAVARLERIGGRRWPLGSTPLASAG